MVLQTHGLINNKVISHVTGRWHNIITHITCKPKKTSCIWLHARNVVFNMWENRKHAACLDEWPPLGHPHKEDGETCCSPLLPARPSCGLLGGTFCTRDRENDNITGWRKQRESCWIFQLRTLAPNGLNIGMTSNQDHTLSLQQRSHRCFWTKDSPGNRMFLCLQYHTHITSFKTASNLCVLYVVLSEGRLRTENIAEV